MNKTEKVNFIISTLDELYGDPQIPLNHYDHYTLLIAVLLSSNDFINVYPNNECSPLFVSSTG